MFLKDFITYLVKVSKDAKEAYEEKQEVKNLRTSLQEKLQNEIQDGKKGYVYEQALKQLLEYSSTLVVCG